MIRHQEGSPVILMLSETARILDLSPAQVRNFTSGRNLKIKPSVAAHGAGSRNVYRSADLYRLAVAAQLNHDGFTAKWIQDVLNQLDLASESVEIVTVTVGGDREVSWAGRTELVVQTVSKDHFDRKPWGVVDQAVRKAVGCYVLAIAGIIEQVDHRIDMFSRGRLADRTAIKTPAPHQARRVKHGSSIEEPFPRRRKFRSDPE
jgi:MerR HTH family regulatory protein